MTSFYFLVHIMGKDLCRKALQFLRFTRLEGEDYGDRTWPVVLEGIRGECGFPPICVHIEVSRSGYTTSHGTHSLYCVSPSDSAKISYCQSPVEHLFYLAFFLLIVLLWHLVIIFSGPFKS